mmetsp:Transcript_44214/g.94851  ORF Transcript_44214/g.94851 Transcript_44214/m.94851 type:complete len:100 (+) Transcript_44214:618-917(+)
METEDLFKVEADVDFEGPEGLAFALEAERWRLRRAVCMGTPADLQAPDSDPNHPLLGIGGGAPAEVEIGIKAPLGERPVRAKVGRRCTSIKWDVISPHL